MTRALLRKELRAMRPWAVLSLCIGLIEVAEALTNQTDMRPLSRTWDDLGDASGIVMWLIAYAVGTGIVSSEHDAGTLAFLDGLPVSRTRVFGVKCVLACALLAIAPCVALLNMIAQHLLSRGSLDSALRMDIVLGLFALQVGAIVHGVFAGAAMGMLRSLTWMVTAAIATALMLLAERLPRSACLNPLSLLKAQVTGAGLLLDGETLRVQLAIALLCALIAWWGFLHSGGPSILTGLSKRPALGATVTVLTVVALTAVLVIEGRRANAAKAARGRAASARGAAHFAASPPAQTATEHYRFAYAADQAGPTLALAAQADAVFERVHAILGAPLGDSIDVDTSGSARNTEGTAYYGRVRLVLNERAPIVLAHETSHVVAQRLAGRERAWLWQKARVLNEGLATYVEVQFAADPVYGEAGASERLANDRLLLAALYTRHELLVPELCDDRLLAAMRDQNLEYPIGAAIVRAMVRLYGPASISRLLRAFADDTLPADLQGQPLMNSVFQRAGMDFAAVLAAFFKQIAEDARLHAAELAALPRARVRLVRRPGAVGVQVLCDADKAEPCPHAVQLRFKPQPDSGFERYDHVLASGDRPVWRAASQVHSGVICVQPGLRIGRGAVLYEPWSCLPTADATRWQERDPAPREGAAAHED